MLKDKIESNWLTLFSSRGDSALRKQINRSIKVSKIYRIIAFLLVVNSNLLLAEQESTITMSLPGIRFEQLSVEQGLSSNFVNCILQDRLGFIWIGTKNGLNRFDGYEAKIYRYDPKISQGLSNNDVSSLYEDPQGYLWIGTPRGLNKFDPVSESFEQFLHDPQDSLSLIDDKITAISADPGNSGQGIWIGTPNGLCRMEIDRQGQRIFQRFIHDLKNNHSPRHQYISALFKDSGGSVWVGTGDLSVKGGGLYRITSIGQKERAFANEGSSASPNELFKVARHYTFPQTYIPGTKTPLGFANWIRSIYENSSNLLWIVAGPSLSKYNLNTKIFTHYNYYNLSSDSLSSYTLNSIVSDLAGNIWLGTDKDGLIKFDIAAGKFSAYRHQPGNPTSLSDNNILSLFRDNSGSVWCATSGGGISKFDPQNNHFKHIKNELLSPEDAEMNNIHSISESDGDTLWLGTGRGPLRFLPPDQLIKFKGERPMQRVPTLSIIEEMGSIWFAGVGMLNINRRQNTMTKLDQKLSHFAVYKLLIDRHETIWVATYNGLNKLDRHSETFMPYLHDPNNPGSISHNEVTTLYEDRSGVLWAGTVQGLNRFDPETASFTRYQHNPHNPHSLRNDAIRILYQDRSGRLWIGTGDGLSRMHAESAARTVSDADDHQVIFSNYTERDGLPNSTINGILEDDAGNLWLATENGLSKFDPDKGEFINYDHTDGLALNRFYPGSCYRNDAGEMFFGGPDGLVIFHPDSIRSNLQPPPVVITALKRFNQLVDLDSAISLMNTVTFPYHENQFSLEFAALNFNYPDLNSYAYKLEGFNEGWINNGSKREASFTNLDPGEYTFRVKGSNDDGIWNETGAALRIIIKPPWYRTWWAYIFFILLIGGGIRAIIRFREQALRQRTEELEAVVADRTAELAEKNVALRELDNMKSRFFANISHEFRTPLTLILGPLDQLMTMTEDSRSAEKLLTVQRNAQRLLGLINELLDLAKLESGKMTLNAKPGDFIQFLKGLLSAFDSLAEIHGINFQFAMPVEEESLQSLRAMPFDHEKMEKIFANLLANAFKFTPDGGSISVELSISEFGLSLRGIRPVPSGNSDLKDKSSEIPPPQSGITEKCVEVRISDSGVGIPPEDLPHIFDRFYQARDESAASQDHIGTGIGMALVKEFVALHQGSITVESEPGKGTTVIIQLPPVGAKPQVGAKHSFSDTESDNELLARNASHLPGPRESSEIPEAADQTRNSEFRIPNSEFEKSPTGQAEIILVVEDNPDMRAYIREELLKDYQLVEAENGREGLDKAIDVIPDLIVSDVMMPKMSGYELCEKLKTDERTSHIPVILLTAKAGEESKIEGLETGADDYLTKPFNFRELRIRVSNLIEQRRKLRVRFSQTMILRPAEVAVTSIDQQFLERVMAVVEENFENESFSVEKLANKVGMSMKNLQRKLRALIDQTPSEFILSMRLQRAADLLKQNAATIAEIAYSTGFNTPNYFTKAFRKQFGCSPKAYREKHTNT